MPRGARAAPDPRPGKALMNVLFFAEQSPFLSRRVGGAENSMRLIAEGLAARGHRVAFASLRPNPLPFPRRFAVNGVARAALPEPAPVARSPARRQARRSASRRPGPRAWARVAERVLGPEGPKADVLYALLRDGVPRRGAAARGEAARPGMAIVMRMAGLGWHDALVRDGGDPAESIRRFNAVDAINYLSPSLARARRGEGGRARPCRWRRASGFVADIGVDVGRVPLRLGAVRAPGPGSTSSSRPASPRRRSARTC